MLKLCGFSVEQVQGSQTGSYQRSQCNDVLNGFTEEWLHNMSVVIPSVQAQQIQCKTSTCTDFKPV